MKMESKLEFCQELCPSDEIQDISIDPSTISKVLTNSWVPEVDNVLIIVDNIHHFNLIKNCLADSNEDYFVYHCSSPKLNNQEGARTWVSGNHEKKFLISDSFTAAGFECENVIYCDQRPRLNLSSNLQRAKSRLLVFTIYYEQNDNQLWKLNSDCTMTNRKHSWIHENIRWTKMPDEQSYGSIEDSIGQSLEQESFPNDNDNASVYVETRERVHPSKQ